MGGWSTRELAELADTTVNTVRYYHRRGLLEEPERRRNGYKQYGAEHLARLLQIRRLRGVGVSVADIERVASDVDAAPEVFAEIDANLVTTIERSTRARAELAEIVAERHVDREARRIMGLGADRAVQQSVAR